MKKASKTKNDLVKFEGPVDDIEEEFLEKIEHKVDEYEKFITDRDATDENLDSFFTIFRNVRYI